MNASTVTLGIHQQGDVFTAKWADFLEKRGVHVRWLNLLRPDALRQIEGCDGVMWHWFHDPTTSNPLASFSM